MLELGVSAIDVECRPALARRRGIFRLRGLPFTVRGRHGSVGLKRHRPRIGERFGVTDPWGREQHTQYPPGGTRKAINCHRASADSVLRSLGEMMSHGYSLLMIS